MHINLIKNLNWLPKAYYIIRARIAVGSIKETKEVPNCECDCQIKCRVTTSNHYYVTHKNKEQIHCINHHWHHYKTFYSQNIVDKRWDFEVFGFISFRLGQLKLANPNERYDNKPTKKISSRLLG